MEPLISLQLHQGRAVYAPGDLLEYEFQIDAIDPAEIQAVETSVLWYTEGKGQQNMAVHFFERHVSGGGEDGDLRQLRQARTHLPKTPLSYEVLILKIRWCVRVRVFLRRGRQASFERPFQLSNVPRAHAVAGESSEKRSFRAVHAGGNNLG